MPQKPFESDIDVVFFYLAWVRERLLARTRQCGRMGMREIGNGDSPVHVRSHVAWRVLLLHPAALQHGGPRSGEHVEVASAHPTPSPNTMAADVAEQKPPFTLRAMDGMSPPQHCSIGVCCLEPLDLHRPCTHLHRPLFASASQEWGLLP